jgi:transposase InsO family protein
MDFFVVPTVTFRLVYAWFAIDHERRRILHFDVTNQPTAAWVVQPLRETFRLDVMPRHRIFDRDSIFSRRVVSTVESFDIKPTRTAYRSPWQNGIAERWVGSVRRELLDHVVVMGERHLRRLLSQYVDYYNDDRTHLGLGPVALAQSLAQPAKLAPAPGVVLSVMLLGRCAKPKVTP